MKINKIAMLISIKAKKILYIDITFRSLKNRQKNNCFGFTLLIAPKLYFFSYIFDVQTPKSNDFNIRIDLPFYVHTNKVAGNKKLQ